MSHPIYRSGASRRCGPSLTRRSRSIRRECGRPRRTAAGRTNPVWGGGLGHNRVGSNTIDLP